MNGLTVWSPCAGLVSLSLVTGRLVSAPIRSQGSSEIKLMSDSDDEPCMLLQDLDTLMRLKYPQTQHKSHNTQSEAHGCRRRTHG